MTDDITHASMVALLARWEFYYNLKMEQVAIRDRAAKKADEADKVLTECKKIAFSLGFDRDAEDWDEKIEPFLSEAADLYHRVRPPNFPPWDGEEKIESDPNKEKQLKIETKSTKVVNDQPRPPIRQIIYKQLHSTGKKGMRASELRGYIEENYAGAIHEKTVGMTLYRMMKDGLVRREGHRWFLDARNANARN
jgi:hypothetical protein